jgi:hypothetical protein
MDLFKSLLQPTIVHFGKNEKYQISDEYLLNYNVVQIDWFKNNSIVLEDGFGILLLEDADEFNPLSASDADAMDIMEDGIKDRDNLETVLDLPRIYFKITDKFLNDVNFITPNVINSFIITLLQLSDEYDNFSVPNYIAHGNTYKGETLVPGVDYFINETFANYLVEIELGVENDRLITDPDTKNIVNILRAITLPDYLTSSSQIKYPWVALNKEEVNNTNLEYYFDKNLVKEFRDDESIRKFMTSFCQTILDYNADKVIPATDITNNIYKKTLEFFANNKFDSALASINLILETNVTTEKINTITNCCKTNTNLESCSSMYNSAMETWLKRLLSDSEFYWEWMMEENEDGNRQPKYNLLKQLMYLLNAFIGLNLDLSLKPSAKYFCTNGCHNDSQASMNNYNILEKYKNVIGYMRECKISSNVNKIKLYGGQFGELLPKLMF